MFSGKDLRDYRLTLGLSLRDVERETYISKKTLIGIEAGVIESKQTRKYLELFYEDKKRKILLEKWASDDDFDEEVPK